LDGAGFVAVCCAAAAEGTTVIFASGDGFLAFFFTAGFAFFVELLSLVK
jgi:hypothetical protein